MLHDSVKGTFEQFTAVFIEKTECGQVYVLDHNEEMYCKWFYLHLTLRKMNVLNLSIYYIISRGMMVQLKTVAIMSV